MLKQTAPFLLLPALLFSGPKDAKTSSATGLDRLVLTVLEMPKPLAACGTAAEIQKMFVERFAFEKGAPRLGKGSDPTLPLLEVWVETFGESPALTRGMAIPNEATVVIPRMRITTFPAPEPGMEGKPKPEIAFEGNAVWWGAAGECKEGLKKAVDALLARFLNEYWNAERK